jgi:hypothetical protein
MTKFIEQIITNPLTGEEKIIEVGDVFLTLSEEDKQKTINEISSKLNWKSKETIEFENELAERQREIDARQMPAAVKPKGIKKVINVASQIAPFAGLALKQTIPGRIIGAGITGGSRIAEGLTRGETAGQAIKSGIKAGTIDLVTGGIGSAIGKGFQLAKKPVSKGMSAMSGAPAESLEYLIENPDLVKGTNLEKVVKSARKSLIKQRKKLSDLNKEQLKEVDKAQKAITLADEKFIKNKVVEDTLKELNKMRGNTARYSEETKNAVKSVLDLIKNDPSPAGRLEILQKIDRSLRKSGAFAAKNDELKVSQLGDTDRLLLKVASKLRGEVKDISKGKVGEIRKEIENISTLTDPLIGKFQKGKRAQGLFRTSREQPIELQEQLRAFSESLPAGEQFYKKGVALSGTEKGMPRISNLLLGASGAAGVGAGLVTTDPMTGLLTTAAGLGLSSPLVQRQIITKGQYVPRVMGKFLARGFTPITRDPVGKITNQEKIEKERGVVK